MLKTLLDRGFKKWDAEVYIYIALNGTQKIKDIAIALKTSNRQVYRSVKKLKEMQFVTASKSVPAKFSVVSFDKVLDLLLESNIKEAKRIEDKILPFWKSSI